MSMRTPSTRQPDRRSRFRDSAPSVALAVFVVASTWAAGLSPIADGDIFWHLTAGREMVERGALLHQDPFSVSAAGRHWIDVHWLFQLGAYAVYRACGLSGIVIGKCLLLSAAVLLLLWGLPRAARAPYALVLSGALYVARNLLLVRPVIVTLLCLAAFVVLLERYRRHGHARTLWPLLAIQVLWSNCQGLFALGPALLGAYAFAAWAAWLSAKTTGGAARGLCGAEWLGLSAAEALQRARVLTAALGGSVLASLATPYGWSSLRLPLTLLDRLLPHADSPYQDVAENLPPLALEHPASAEFWHLKWFLLLLAASLGLRARRVPLSHLIVLAGFVGLSLLGNRNVLLLYFVGTALMAVHIAPSARWLRRWTARRALPLASAWPFLYRGTCAVLLAGSLAAAAREPAIAQPTPFHFPTESAHAIAAHGGSGSIFSADHQGGYLMWQLFPKFRPYVDTRWVLRSPQELHDYLALADNPERWDGFASRHDFAYVVLPVAYPDRYLGLITALYESPRWRLVFTDGSEVLFARADLVQGGSWDLDEARTTDRLLANVQARYGDDARLVAAARMQLASLQTVVGAFEQALRVLQPLTDPAAIALRARVHLLSGELDPAGTLAERMLQALPDDVRSLDLMAQVCVRRGQHARALDLLRRAVQIDPFDAEAMSLLSALEVQRHDP